MPTSTPDVPETATGDDRARPVIRWRWGMFAAAFAVFLALGLGWAFASPVFSVPDENAHALKAIAQVRGQVIGENVEGVKHLVVDLPPGYEYNPNMMCFAFADDVPASCAPELGAAGGQDWFNTWVGAYNPIYYWLVGWPSLLVDGSASIYAMRIASAVLGSFLLAWAFQAAVASARSRWMPIGVAFAAAPMCVYFIGAVNPNGLEIASAVALWAGLLRLLETFDDRATDRPTLPRPYLWAMVAVSAALLANARATGPAWAVLVVLLGLLAGGWPRVRRLFSTASSYWWIGGIAVFGLFSLAWTYFGGSLSGQAEAGDAPLVNGTFAQGVSAMVRRTPMFLHQALGYFGWFDAALPVWAYWLPVAAIGLVVGLALIGSRRRSTLVLLAVLLAAFAVPVLVQAYSVHQTGIIWQGRYGLFLYLGVLVVAAWLLDEQRLVAGFATRAGWLVGPLVAAYGLLAFGIVLVRYVIGRDLPFGDMVSDPQWQPPFGWPALVAWYAVASLALVVLVGIATKGSRSADEFAEPASRTEGPVPAVSAGA
ncbi:DUF2142 domain-containing protein [Agromyces seonyuensis]|uniref:DUF2142 domain-containing protein n=1 Tax=Agromyces seonyuensis TaxID=2662446 RepID=A0A6I4NY56_9MICO|nr:DUF2142 domain-containing protein [Agromyces seonyuensis]MWB99246.1 DUF2142 domain-containing protein [Agromyces seonyuensis]